MPDNIVNLADKQSHIATIRFALEIEDQNEANAASRKVAVLAFNTYEECLAEAQRLGIIIVDHVGGGGPTNAR